MNHSLGLDIKNSNFPPSSDKLGKKKQKSTNNRNNCDDIRNKTGGQNGHKGNNLKFGWRVDKEIEYRPSFSYVKTKYTHDIAIKKEIINYNIYNSSCGFITKAACDLATWVYVMHKN